MAGLWAVHISDGVLSGPWVLGGFCGMALLMLAACYRVRDEEIPRIALLTAAFFVASLVHVRVGPTSAHLLLNGLVGVVLGVRAGLAIPMGLLLQAVLFGHGGISALGVNACVQAVPAIVAGLLFRRLRAARVLRRPWTGSAVVATTVLAFLESAAFGGALLFADWSDSTGGFPAGPALRFALHPLVVAGSLVLALGCAYVERRERLGPDFALGLGLGVCTVLATLALNAAALLFGGAENWEKIVRLVFVVNLPLAGVEGVVVGFTVSFLARVKPELLDGPPRTGPSDLQPLPEPAAVTNGTPPESAPARRVTLPVAILLAGLAGLVAPGTAQAHRLEAECRVLPDGKVQVESWFDLTGDSPHGATVQVFRPGGQLVTEGKLDEKGLFTFDCGKAESLRVVVSAGAGHRKELIIPKGELERSGGRPAFVPAADLPSASTGVPFADRTPRVTSKDVLTGVGFLMALAAFVLGIRNAKAIREMRRGG